MRGTIKDGCFDNRHPAENHQIDVELTQHTTGLFAVDVFDDKKAPTLGSRFRLEGGTLVLGHIQQCPKHGQKTTDDPSSRHKRKRESVGPLIKLLQNIPGVQTTY